MPPFCLCLGFLNLSANIICAIYSMLSACLLSLEHSDKSNTDSLEENANLIVTKFESFAVNLELKDLLSL